MTNEQYLVGAILMDGTAMDMVNPFVTPSDFEDIYCREVFEAALTISKDGGVIDPLTIMDHLKRAESEVTETYLMDLMELCPSPKNCVEYARRVAEDARARSIKALAQRICEDEHSTADEMLAALKSGCDAICGSSYQKGLLSPSDTFVRLYDHMVASMHCRDNFVPCGYTQLDSTLGGGFIRGGLYIIGARPAVGKTTFALNLVDGFKGACLFVSLEMTAEQIAAKRIARLTGLPPSDLLAVRLNEAEWEKVNVAASALSQREVYLNRRYDLTVGQIHLLAQSVQGLSAIVVDYLGLIQPTQRGGKLYETVTATSRELKRMALDLNVPVICLCQLSRQTEQRSNKQPQLSDLRDSGAIEQDADAVLFLFLEDYYDGAGDDAPSLVQLIVAKNRHGRLGTSEFSFFRGTGEFREVSS